MRIMIEDTLGMDKNSWSGCGLSASDVVMARAWDCDSDLLHMSTRLAQESGTSVLTSALSPFHAVARLANGFMWMACSQFKETAQ